MAIEKAWAPVSPKILLVDGTKDGLIQVSSTANLYVKQEVILQNNPNDAKTFEVKAVLSKILLVVGPKNTPLSQTSDVTEFLAGAIIFAPRQTRPKIPENEFERASFAEEPIVAKRVIHVDGWGDYYTQDNPFPVDLQVKPTVPIIKNIIIQESDTLDNFQLPANVKKIMAKLRIGCLSIAFSEEPEEFITLPFRVAYSVEGINYTGSIFFKSSKDNDVLELEIWT